MLLKEAQKAIVIGSRVRFADEPGKQLYKVRAISPDKRYMICTKPYNPRRTYIYCILDFKRGVRAPDDRLFSEGYETQEQIEARMAELRAGKIGLSRRHEATLCIAAVLPPYQRDTGTYA